MSEDKTIERFLASYLTSDMSIKDGRRKSAEYWTRWLIDRDDRQSERVEGAESWLVSVANSIKSCGY